MRRFLKDERGNTALVVALLMPVLCGFAVLAVDTANVQMNRQQLQTAADAAALAAAQNLLSVSAAQSAAREIAAANMEAGLSPVVIGSDIHFGRWDTATKQFTAASTNVNAVRVIAVRSRERSNPVTTVLASFIGFNFVDISASAIAVAGGVPACVYALDPTARESFSTRGAGTVSVPNCGIQVNSSDASALRQSGSGSIVGKTISVVGGFTRAGRYFPAPITGAPSLPDPLRTLPEPAVPATCTFSNITFDTPQHFAGETVYCGAIGLNADTTFGPGIHYFKGATVTAGSNAAFNGDGVMLYFDDISTWDSTGSGVVNIRAPRNGTYKGVAFFGTRQGSMSTFKIRGSKDYNVIGTMYLPTQRLEVYGTIDLNVSSRNGYVIAQQFFYQGDSSFSFDAFGGEIPDSMISSRTQLVH